MMKNVSSVFALKPQVTKIHHVFYIKKKKKKKTAGSFWPTQYYKLAFSKNCERKFLNLEWKGLTFFEIW